MKNFVWIALLALAMISCQIKSEFTEVSEKQIPINEALVSGNEGALLIKEMIDASEGLEKYYALEDAQYIYTYKDAGTEQEDISMEQYQYDKERSYAKYQKHTKSVYPDEEGEVIHGYNGEESWVTLNGELMTGEQDMRRADFTRKTNFYWFNMMYKLLDPGTNYAVKPDRVADDMIYKIVEVTFGEDVGDVQDIYVLYINPETKLVDQFLFTVMDFGRSEPLLMQVKYEEVDGMKWPAYRRYTATDWDAVIPEDATWTEEISTDIKLNTGMFDESLFEPPT